MGWLDDPVTLAREQAHLDPEESWGSKAERWAGRGAKAGLEKGGETLTEPLEDFIPGGDAGKWLVGGSSLDYVYGQFQSSMANTASEGETEMVLEAAEQATRTTGTRSHLDDIKSAADASTMAYAQDTFSAPSISDVGRGAVALGKDAVGYGADKVTGALTDLVPGGKYLADTNLAGGVIQGAEKGMAQDAVTEELDVVLGASDRAFAQLGRDNSHRDKQRLGQQVQATRGDGGVISDAFAALYAHMKD
jgi:hypothetical protein